MQDDSRQYEHGATFIGGFPKSGTSLLLSLLDSHPELLVIPEESFFFSRVMPSHNRATALLEHTYLANLKEETVENEGWGVRHHGHFDFETFAREIKTRVTDTISDKEALLELVVAFARAEKTPNRTRWVEKTPGNELYAHLIRKWFPGGLLLQVVRDPRDNFASYKKHRGKKGESISIESLCLRWAVSVECVLRLEKKNAARMVVYENLVRDPETIMRSLAEYMGITYNKTLIEPSIHGSAWSGNSMHNTQHRGISTSSVGVYGDRLTLEEIGMIQSYLKSYMIRFGYAFDEHVPEPSMLQKFLFRAKLLKLIHWNYRHVWSSFMLPGFLPGVYRNSKKRLAKRTTF